ncbi:MAG: xylose isomerase [Isosphaera sp.]|nr:xylose isomerase [Isosphaera sp.]
MNRRAFLLAAPLGPLALARTAAARNPMGLVVHSYWVRAKKPLPPDFPAVSDPLALVAEAARVGAAGVQTRIPADADTKKLRDAADKHGLYLEGSVGLPKTDADVARFEADVKACAAAGADILRTVCMSGRRYEVFESADQFKAFAGESWEALKRAEPVAAKHKVTLAVENHKDWRTDEMVGWLKKLGSDRVRVCLDTGNSVALLEDPAATAEALAPFTVTTHLKDMAASESDDGFLLSEVPFGDGFLDLPKVVGVLRKANPRVRLNLEMITRDPLRVPCLTAKYWATMPALPARDLADALARVRRNKPPRPLPTISTLDHAGQLKAEAASIDRCLAFAAAKLAG